MILAAALAGPTRAATGAWLDLAAYLAQPAVAYGGLGVLVVARDRRGPTPATRQFFADGSLMIIFLAIGLEVLRRQTAREHPEALHGNHPSARAHLSGLAGRVRDGAGKLSLPDFGDEEDDRFDALERSAS